MNKTIGRGADALGRAMALFAELGGDSRNHEYLHANWLRMERLKQSSSAWPTEGREHREGFRDRGIKPIEGQAAALSEHGAAQNPSHARVRARHRCRSASEFQQQHRLKRPPTNAPAY
jgi:hypothetical protein